MWRSRATARSLRSGRRARGPPTSNFALARYNPNGTLDTSFSGDGKQTTDFGGVDEANGVAIRADGKIVAVGDTESSATGGDFAIARYNPSGALDPSFSGDGKQTTAGVHFFEANGVAIQSDDKIVAVGGAFALARYNPNGSLDTSFSGDGKRVADFNGSANAVTVQANGKIVAVGGSESSGSASDDFALARYNPNGTLDTSFSGDGKQTTDFGGEDEANGVAIQEDGKIIVVGAAGTRHNGIGFALARYNPNGTLDTSFSGDGKQTTEFDLGSGQVANAVVVQDDGKIVVVGNAFGPMFSEDFAIARYNPNGSLDTSFSGDGKQTASFLTTAEANGVAIQGDGKIVVVGTGVDNINGGSEGAIVRYNPNGTLDTSFSGDGTQTTDFGLGEGAQATGVAIQGDGKIVIVGSAGADSNSQDFALARYNPDGSLDTSFSGDGTQTTDLGGSDEAAEVALQGDGKIVAVGEAEPGTSGDDFALARYNPERVARHELLRRRQADDRLRVRGRRRGERRGGPGRRQDRRGWRRQRGGHRRRLCPRPLQPRRLARHDLLRRRQTEDQLRGRRRGERSGAPGWTAGSSRSGVASVSTKPATSRSPATWGAEPRVVAAERRPHAIGHRQRRARANEHSHPRAARLAAMDRTALIVVDVQRGFDDAGFFGPRNNTACEQNVRALIAAWRGGNQPIVFVRHHWDEDGSPLRPDEAGSEFKDVVEGRPDLLVTKTVHSAFHGTPDLHDWLRKDEIRKPGDLRASRRTCAARRRRESALTSATRWGSRSTPPTLSIRRITMGRRSRPTSSLESTASNLDPEFGRVLSTDAAIAELNATGGQPQNSSTAAGLGGCQLPHLGQPEAVAGGVAKPCVDSVWPLLGLLGVNSTPRALSSS